MPNTVWKKYRSLREPSAGVSVWSLPTDDEHILNTGSPEDLLLNPEDFDVVPERVQEHETVWSIDLSTMAEWYTLRMPSRIAFEWGEFFYWTLETPASLPHWYTFTSETSVFDSVEI